MENIVIVIVFIIIVKLIEYIVNKKNTKQEISDNKISSDNYQSKRYLMTNNELKYYKLLLMICKKYNLEVFSQVALYSIIKTTNISEFNKIKSKTIDFVITDNNSKIILCIELDDTTHLKDKRIKRDVFIDEIFEKANIKLLRVPVQNYYNMNIIEQKLKESFL